MKYYFLKIELNPSHTKFMGIKGTNRLVELKEKYGNDLKIEREFELREEKQQTVWNKIAHWLRDN